MRKNRVEKLNKMIRNVYRMLKYAYINDLEIKGKNIKYGYHRKQYYKLYNGDDKKATIVFIHGGGWWQGSPSLYSGVGKFFAKRGYKTIIIGYRLVPYYRYPTQIEDVFMALKHYMDNNKLDEKIIIGGYSAGGELSAHLAFDVNMQNQYKINSEKIKGFISLAGVLDFDKCTSRVSKRLIYNYIKCKSIKCTNPINLLNNTNTIPTLCVHGLSDTLINVNNSISFVEKLKKLNNSATLITINNYEHEDIIDIVRGKENTFTKHIFDFIEAEVN